MTEKVIKNQKTSLTMSNDITSLDLAQVKKEIKAILKADVFTKFSDLIAQYAKLTSLAFSAENQNQKMAFSDFKALLLGELITERIPYANVEKKTYMTLDSILNTAKKDAKFASTNATLVKQCKAIRNALDSFDTDSLFKKQAKGGKPKQNKVKDYKDTHKDTLNALIEHLAGGELDSIAKVLANLLDDAQRKALAEILLK